MINSCHNLAASQQAWFSNRVAVLATMHQKERVIAPLLKQAINLDVMIPKSFDTDAFGTFTRDRDRPGTQLEAARLKALAALDQTGATLAIASEGSFGPHPSFPAIAANRELVILLDRQQDLEIVGEVVSLNTNYRHQTIHSLEEATVFAKQIGFPEHGIVVMPHAAATEEIVKGITTREQLEIAVTTLLQRSVQAHLTTQSPPSLAPGTIHIETDMRAMHNPTRMGVIEQATQDLIQAIQRSCVHCGAPGLQLVARKLGLPCELCGLPTALTASITYRCQKCGTQQEIQFPDGNQTADPGQCQYCNP
jgi:DNA-directed RNA polymerase subunit RPC12/RpoP